MLDHLGIQCADMSASSAFYDTVLEPLGASRLMDFGVAIRYGVPPEPDFWLGELNSGDGFRESHIAFTAPDRARGPIAHEVRALTGQSASQLVGSAANRSTPLPSGSRNVA